MKKTRFLCIMLSALILLLPAFDSHGRKIRQSLKVKTGKSVSRYGNVDSLPTENMIVLNICDSDTVNFIKDSIQHSLIVSGIRFAGYDKTVSAAKESFHTINETPYDISEITVRIIYKDMKDRMLHSREVTIKKEIPHDETRKIDIPSWDTQKAFYYYLSNEPKRVASPYKVSITPVSLVIY